MVLIETLGRKKTKIRDSETSRPKIRESETQRNTRKRDFETLSKRLRDFKIGTKISETLNFPDTIRHPLSSVSAPIKIFVCLLKKDHDWEKNRYTAYGQTNSISDVSMELRQLF